MTTVPTSWLSRILQSFRSKPRQHHVWKEESEENLGSFVHFGSNIHDICTMYRIAVHERCLVTGDTRIRERTDLFPISKRK